MFISSKMLGVNIQKPFVRTWNPSKRHLVIIKIYRA
jgi:hypothetical protein